MGVPIRQGWQELPPITFCHGVQLANQADDLLHGLETAGTVKLALGECII